MADVRVPKSMSAEAVTWAFRYGVVCGMRARGRVIPRQGLGYVIAPRNVLMLGDRIRVEWMRRHPTVTPKEGTP